MSIWTDLGFSASPYNTNPIPATEDGAHLLVGRNKELRRLKSRLTSSALHPTIEGDNGVGKTSLVSVAGYELLSEFREGKTGQALLPLDRTFQLTPEKTVEELNREVLFAVASAFVKHHALLKGGGFSVPDVSKVDNWLHAPTFGSREFGGQAAGFGANAAWSSEPNTSAGFAEAGFAATVVKWLSECFPTPQAGGFICVIDNLELLETSNAARTQLEAMRDTGLNLPGLRWVLCGARGIVRSGASSQRLEGRLAEPLEIPPVLDEDVPALIKRRIELYGVIDEALAPVDTDGFRLLYGLLNRNLRNSLKFCEDFSLWASDEDIALTVDNRLKLLHSWINSQARKSMEATKLGGRAWQVFDQLVELGGSCSPGDFADLSFNSSMAMRPHVKALEEANLVQSSVDDSDKRRRTIVVTPRGWLVNHHRGASLA